MRCKPLYYSLLPLLIAGCTRLGGEYARQDLPPGAPDPVSVLAELARNEAAVGGFKATGDFSLQSPEVAGVQLLRQSTVYYRHPSDLHVLGRKYTSVVMRLTCANDGFILEFPTEKEFIQRAAGEYVAELGAQTTPAWIAREMFRPAAWEEIAPERLRVAAYDEAAQTMAVDILREGSRHAIERRLHLAGPPWVILKSELYGADANLVAVTEKSDYRNVDGLLFPAQVSTLFPQSGAEMRISMRKIYVNEAMDESLFDLEKTLQRLDAENYSRVEAYEDVNVTP